METNEAVVELRLNDGESEAQTHYSHRHAFYYRCSISLEHKKYRKNWDIKAVVEPVRMNEYSLKIACRITLNKSGKKYLKTFPS